MADWNDPSRPSYSIGETADGKVKIVRLHVELLDTEIGADLVTIRGPADGRFELRYATPVEIWDQPVVDGIVAAHQGALGRFAPRYSEEEFDDLGRLVAVRKYSDYDDYAGVLKTLLEQMLITYVGETTDKEKEIRTRYDPSGKQTGKIVTTYSKTSEGGKTFIRKKPGQGESWYDDSGIWRARYYWPSAGRGVLIQPRL